jgi:hypothetical protein
MLSIEKFPDHLRKWLLHADNGLTLLPGYVITRYYDAATFGIIVVERMIDFEFDDPGDCTDYGVDDIWAEVILAVSASLPGDYTALRYAWQTRREDDVYAVFLLSITNTGVT